MDDEISSRIRDAVLAAVERQRPQPDSEAAKQQMLVTTLRLAGHTVNLLQNEPAESGGDDPLVENDPADGIAGSGETILSHPSVGDGNPLVSDALYRVNDPTRPGDYGKAQLLPDIVNDPARPARRLLPDIIVNPARPPGGGLPRAKPIGVPQPYDMPPGPVPDEAEEPPVTDDDLDASSDDFEVTPADSDGASLSLNEPSAADPMPADDEPPALSIAPADDSADSAPPPAPGIKLFFPSPGAGSFSFPPAIGGDDVDGGDSQPLDSEGGQEDGQTPGSPPAIIVEPTQLLIEEFLKAAADSVLPLAQKAVDTGMSDLRHEIYVSRAARNALFPR